MCSVELIDGKKYTMTDTNAVYRVRFNEVLRYPQLITADQLGLDADVSTISHNQDFLNGEPVRVVYTEVVYESETPPMHLPHTILEADNLNWLESHLSQYDYEESGTVGQYFWNPRPGTSQ